MKTFKIVSGAQTGVDLGALDAALNTGLLCGGWCPEGRYNEEGSLPDKYPLKELKDGHYIERTLENVLDSDGTLIIYFKQLEGGTELTLRFCIEREKPYQLIDATEVSSVRAAEKLVGFIKSSSIQTLNVAGPRASKQPEAYAYTYDCITQFLKLYT